MSIESNPINNRAFWETLWNSLSNPEELNQFVDDELGKILVGYRGHKALLRESLGEDKFAAYSEFTKEWLLVHFSQYTIAEKSILISRATRKAKEKGLLSGQLKEAKERGQGIFSRWVEKKAQETNRP